MNQAVIVVPVYRPSLTAGEEISLRHLQYYLGAYPRCIVHPCALKLQWPDFKKVAFPDDFFRSPATYNKLLLTKSFYGTFADYEYMLIYQLDCLVFSSALAEWCTGEFDFVGAPILRDRNNPALGFSEWRNGGLSLRRISSFKKVLRSKSKVFSSAGESMAGRAGLARRLKAFCKTAVCKTGIWSDLKWCLRHYRLNEDIFWSQEARLFEPEFKVAGLNDALRFAFECEPRLCFEMNGKQMPFGCHAWGRYDRSFWLPHLLKA
jgi:hypothetical protein